jgi:hypothetical protein
MSTPKDPIGEQVHIHADSQLRATNPNWVFLEMHW